MRKVAWETSILVCPTCNNIFPIPRKKKRKRKVGHEKTIWCPYCKDYKQFIEHQDEEVVDNVDQ